MYQQRRPFNISLQLDSAVGKLVLLVCAQLVLLPGSATSDSAPSDVPILNGVCSLATVNPCVAEAKCYPSVPVLGDAVCVCPKGYRGNGRKPERGGDGCYNLDECQTMMHDCDTQTQDCIDLEGSFRCECRSGFLLAPNGRTCLDIDECRLPRFNTCDPYTSVCRNLEGSFRCDCLDPTQIGDPLTGICRDMNECEDMGGAMNPCNQVCIDIKGGVECGCHPGWTLGRDGHTCLDVDECRLGQHTCDTLGQTSRCVNTPGSYRCECNEELGYQDSGDGNTCTNLNECEEYPYICGGANSCCRDLPPPQRFACMVPTQQGIVGHITGGSNKQPISNAVGDMFGMSATPPPNLLNQPQQVLDPSPSCLQHDTLYDNWDMYLNPIQFVDSAWVCQMYCRNDQMCSHFTYHVPRQQCYLKTSGNGQTFAPNFVSGPKSCSSQRGTQSSQQQHGVAAIRNRISSSNSSPSHQQPQYPIIGQSLPPQSSNGRGILNGNIASAVLGRKLQAENGDETAESFGSQAVVKNYGTLSTGVVWNADEETDRPQVVSNEDALEWCQDNEMVCLVAHNLSHPEIQQRVLNMVANVDPMSPESSLSVKFSEKRPALRFLSDNSSGGGGTISRISNTIHGGAQCAPGFQLAATTQKAKVRANAIKTIHSVITQGTVGPDGSTGPLTADAVGDAIARNVVTVATEATKMYSGFSASAGDAMMFVSGGNPLAAGALNVARVAGPAVSAANSFTTGASGTLSGSGFIGGAGAGFPGVRQGGATEARMMTKDEIALAIGGTAVAAGLISAGVEKLKYGGGPGDSPFMDRTGKSRQMAYGMH